MNKVISHIKKRKKIRWLYLSGSSILSQWLACVFMWQYNIVGVYNIVWLCGVIEVRYCDTSALFFLFRVAVSA